MEFYATGLTRAGVEEVRVGPFASMEEAKAAGERKTKESNGDFVFEAVMDEAGHQVFKVEPLLTANAIRSANRVVQNVLNAMAKNAEESFDENFVRTKLDSVYNDLDDLEDYIERFKSKTPKYAKYRPMVSAAKRAIQ